MAGDESEDGGPSLLPTYVSRPDHRGLGRSERDRHPRPELLRAGDDRAGASAGVGFTHTLLPLDRLAQGTVSVTPSDGLRGAAPVDPSDTLIDARGPAVDAPARSRGATLAIAAGVSALIGTGLFHFATREPSLPPLEPLAIDTGAKAPAEAGSLAFLGRSWPGRAPAASPDLPREAGPRTEPARGTKPAVAAGARGPSAVPPAASPSPAPIAPSPITPPPTTEGPDATASIVARRDGQAAAAEIWVDGRSVGQAPLRLPLRPGRHTIEARAGAARTSQTVDLAPGKPHRVVLELDAP